MHRFFNIKRDVLTAFILGLGALVTNMFAMSLGNGIDYFPVGNIFLFLSALSLGVPGAIVACISGASWEILVSKDIFEFLRLTVCCAALGYSAKKLPKLPGFAIALALWLAVFAPFQLFSASIGKFTFPIDAKMIFTRGMIEVLLVMISGVILLNSRVWALIANSARRMNISSLLIHVITCVTTIAMFAVASALIGSSSFSLNISSHPERLGGLMSVFLLGISLPALLAWRLGVLLSNNIQELFSAGFLTNTVTKSFSGLSSEYWRRQSMPDISRDQIMLQRAAAGEQQQAPAKEESPKKGFSPEHGLCALNRNGTVTFMNRRFKKYCEITSNEVLGKNLSALAINPILCKRILAILEETFTKGERTSEVKINQLPEKLRFYEIATHKSESFEESSIINGPDSIIVTLKDITEKRTVDAHLLQSQKLESLGVLVEGIAHTFNNSLTTIAGQASFAKRSNDRQQIEKSLNEILKTAFSAGSVVRQLLEFASSRPGRIKEENLVEVLTERWDLLKRIAGDNCEIVIENSASEIGVMCDTNLIMQALTNLILNAKEAYPSLSGRVVVSIDIEEVDEEVTELHPGTRPGSFARLRVKDFGHGMSIDVMGKAFDPLFTTKGSAGHTGLGLAIVFAIVRAHDGFLTAESYIGKGTMISLYLPLHELMEYQPKDKVEERASEEVATTNPELLGNDERILVVEDEENVRNMVSAMLTSLGYRVEVSGDGVEALGKAKAEQFDLILADMIIPKMKGLELIGQLRKENICKQCLIMTGYDAGLQPPDPAVKILHKPFDLDTLARSVKESLKSA